MALPRARAVCIITVGISGRDNSATSARNSACTWYGEWKWKAVGLVE
ncbi:MAG TPA: hypothetical protein VFZ70_16365 [Euzebyales bacterium]